MLSSSASTGTKSIFCGIFADEKGQRCLLVMHRLTERILRELYDSKAGREQLSMCLDDIHSCWTQSTIMEDVKLAEAECRDMSSILREKLVEYVREMRGSRKTKIRVRLPNLLPMCHMFFLKAADNSYLRNGSFFRMGPVDQRFIIQDVLKDTFYVFSISDSVKVEKLKEEGVHPLSSIPEAQSAPVQTLPVEEEKAFSSVTKLDPSDKDDASSSVSYPDESVSAVNFGNNQRKELERIKEASIRLKDQEEDSSPVVPDKGEEEVEGLNLKKLEESAEEDPEIILPDEEGEKSGRKREGSDASSSAGSSKSSESSKGARSLSSVTSSNREGRRRGSDVSASSSSSASSSLSERLKGVKKGVPSFVTNLTSSTAN